MTAEVSEMALKVSEKGPKLRDILAKTLSFLAQALGGTMVRIISTPGQNQTLEPQGLTSNNFTSFRLSIHKLSRINDLQRRGILEKITARWQLFYKVKRSPSQNVREWTEHEFAAIGCQGCEFNTPDQSAIDRTAQFAARMPRLNAGDLIQKR